jgi:hypothetical protein
MTCGPQDLRRFALALPEAYEDTHRGKPTFRVQARIVAMLSQPGGQGFMGLDAADVAVLKLEREDQLNMAAAHPGVVTPTETYGHRGWTYVRLGELAAADLETLVRLAWLNVAPKRLSRAL